MIYITGDTHRNFDRIKKLCTDFSTTKNDLVIILGDSGINYYEDDRDRDLKAALEKLPITFMLVRGNHEMRPDKKSYEESLIIREEYSGIFLVEKKYPSLLFAIDGDLYKLYGKWAHVYGGAYSVDKPLRISMQTYYPDYKWFHDEQLTEQELKKFYQDLVWCYQSVEVEKPDVILSHTCPKKYIPREMFLSGIDQSEVDDTMEWWFDLYEELLPSHVKWYCGHWHTDKVDGRMRFMFQDIRMLEI